MTGLLVETVDTIRYLTLDRPPHNFYDDDLQEQLTAAWNDVAETPSLRVVVLRANGKNFCGGHDVDLGLNAGRPGVAVELLAAQTAVDIPTIAAVQGGCVGGGLRFAWACDLIYAAENSYFRDPTAAMGQGGIGLYDSVWDYGPRLAKQMLFTGKGIPAPRLEALGAVNGVVPPDALWSTVDEVAGQIAARPPEAVRQAKSEVNRAVSTTGRDSSAVRFADLTRGLIP